jgi:hypothetical protein
MVIVKLDYHIAAKTDAKTYWKVKFGDRFLALRHVGKRLISTTASHKTHWTEYWDIPLSTDFKLIRVRFSNRGNPHVEEVPISAVAISPEEEEALMVLLGGE